MPGRTDPGDYLPFVYLVTYVDQDTGTVSIPGDNSVAVADFNRQPVASSSARKNHLTIISRPYRITCSSVNIHASVAASPGTEVGSNRTEQGPRQYS